MRREEELMGGYDSYGDRIATLLLYVSLYPPVKATLSILFGRRSDQSLFALVEGKNFLLVGHNFF